MCLPKVVDFSSDEDMPDILFWDIDSEGEDDLPSVASSSTDDEDDTDYEEEEVDEAERCRRIYNNLGLLGRSFIECKRLIKKNKEAQNREYSDPPMVANIADRIGEKIKQF